MFQSEKKNNSQLVHGFFHPQLTVSCIVTILGQWPAQAHLNSFDSGGKNVLLDRGAACGFGRHVAFSPPDWTGWSTMLCMFLARNGHFFHTFKGVQICGLKICIPFYLELGSNMDVGSQCGYGCVSKLGALFGSKIATFRGKKRAPHFETRPCRDSEQMAHYPGAH